MISAMDGRRNCFIKRRKMDVGEYRGFTDMLLFFNANGNVLYKIVMEQTFSSKTVARDRASTINEVIADLKHGYRLSLTKALSNDNCISYHADDERFDVSLELHRSPDGTRQLVISVVDKKAQLEENNTNRFDADSYIEVSI